MNYLDQRIVALLHLLWCHFVGHGVGCGDLLILDERFDDFHHLVLHTLASLLQFPGSVQMLVSCAVVGGAPSHLKQGVNWDLETFKHICEAVLLTLCN